MPLSAHYDIAHGRGMAIVIPPYLEYFAESLPDRWAKLARRVFGVDEKDDVKAAKMLAPKVIEWFESVGMHFKLSDMGVKDDKFDRMAEDVMRMFGNPEEDKIASIIPTSIKDMVNIYKLAM
jgi:alcohol dehydrogenase YqhD (iron-dependent ADH family)